MVSLQLGQMRLLHKKDTILHHNIYLNVLFGINTLKHDEKKKCIPRHNRYLHDLFVHSQMDVYMVYKPMQDIEIFCHTKVQKKNML